MGGTEGPAGRRVGGRGSLRCAAAAGTLLVSGLLLVPPAPAAIADGAPEGEGPGTQEAASGFIPGSGAADAQGLRLGPLRSGFNFSTGFSVSLAEYTNSIAKANSRFIDQGALVSGVLEGLDDEEADPEEQQPSERVPQPLQADTRDEGAAEGFEETVAGSPPGSPLAVAAGTQSARATQDPVGEAVTQNARLGVEGALVVEGGYTRALAGVVGAGQREARGVSVFEHIAVADTVVLRDVRFEAVHRSGAEEVVDAGYSIGSLVVDGEPVELPASAETGEGLVSAFEEANAALAELGVELVPPQRHVNERSGRVRVSPLAIRFGGSEPTRAITEPLLEQTSGPLSQLREALAEADETFAVPFLFLDVALGPLAGAGEIVAEIGGARAVTDASAFADPFAQGRESLDRDPVEPPEGRDRSESPSTPSTSPSSGSGSEAGGRGELAIDQEAPAPEESAPAPETLEQEAPARDDGAAAPQAAAPAGTSSAGGPLLTVGLAVLLAGAALGGTDLVRLRRAQRTIAA